MTEQVVSAQPLNDRRNPVVAPHSQVVALGDVVGEHHAGVLADAGEHGEQHIAFQGLGLVDDDEGIVQGAAANVGEG